MKISHKILNVNNNQTIYLYITVEDIYEFGKENLGKGENSNLLTKLREYIANNLSELKKSRCSNCNKWNCYWDSYISSALSKSCY